MKIIKISAIWCPGCLVMKKVWKNILNDYQDLNIIDIKYSWVSAGLFLGFKWALPVVKGCLAII